jgi:hypothetical protein
VLPIYQADGWVRLYAASYAGLASWYRHESVRSVFRELAPALAQMGTVSRYALLSMFEVAGAAHCPDPRFEPVLPPARRAPSPAPQVSSPSVRRRVELQVVPARAAQDADEPLVLEDAKHRYFGVDNMGDINLYRRVNKSTRSTTFLVVQTVGQDGQGKPVVRGSQHISESDARKAMVRMAG